MRLKPIAQTLVRHKLAQLTKLSIEWFPKDSHAMNYQIGDWMIAGIAVHVRVRLTKQR